jgi:hypothetical protein
MSEYKYFLDRYKVYSDGRIMKLDGINEFSYESPRGYKRVLLMHMDGTKKKYSVHRVVAELFCNKEDELDVVNHIDGNKMNNDSSNLEWCDSRYNANHAISIGLTSIGSLHSRLKNAHRSSKVINEKIGFSGRAEKYGNTREKNGSFGINPFASKTEDEMSQIRKNKSIAMLNSSKNTGVSQRVKVFGLEYISIAEAARSIGYSPKYVIARLNDIHNKEFIRL